MNKVTPTESLGKNCQLLLHKSKIFHNLYFMFNNLYFLLDN